MTIKDLITASGMTQAKFAEYFGIPKRTIECWVTTSASKRGCSEYLLNLMEYKLRAEGKIE